MVWETISSVFTMPSVGKLGYQTVLGFRLYTDYLFELLSPWGEKIA